VRHHQDGFATSNQVFKQAENGIGHFESFLLKIDKVTT
jgi:hypothetical protein